MLRPGVRLGVDVGKARIGVARCDAHAMLATPLETIARDEGGERDIVRITELAAELDAVEVIVGLPLNMRGEVTLSTQDAIGFAEKLAHHRVPVRLVDERLSTVSAHSQLRATGKKTKHTRAIIDQQAAVNILQHALDTERSLGTPPGTLVHTHQAPPNDGTDSHRA